MRSLSLVRALTHHPMLIGFVSTLVPILLISPGFSRPITLQPSSFLHSAISEPGEYTQEQIRYFMEVAMGAEYSNVKSGAKIRKWQEDLRIQVLGTPTEADLKTLETVAKSISNSVYTINSEQRKALHVAAVFVSNFTNYLYQIGNDICLENELPFAILKPLIQETANKIVTLSPAEAQTGPAKRQDTQTITSHLNFLTNDDQKEIYKLLTKSIIDNGKKL